MTSFAVVSVGLVAEWGWPGRAGFVTWELTQFFSAASAAQATPPSVVLAQMTHAHGFHATGPLDVTRLFQLGSNTEHVTWSKAEGKLFMLKLWRTGVLFPKVVSFLNWDTIRWYLLKGFSKLVLPVFGLPDALKLDPNFQGRIDYGQHYCQNEFSETETNSSV